MGFFKLFTNLLAYPDAIIIIAFVFLLDIIILIKIDKLEKEVENLKNEMSLEKDKLNKLKEEAEQLGEETDIIDKFLTEGGFEILGRTSKKTNKNSVEKAKQTPKISNLMNPSLDNEEEDK